jgi:hypothetical protein
MTASKITWDKFTTSADFTPAYQLNMNLTVSRGNKWGGGVSGHIFVPAYFTLCGSIRFTP